MFQVNAVQEIKTHISCSINFIFFFENLSVHELMWRNPVESGRPQITILRTRNACSIPKATNTHSEYVILIAFPLQQLLQERTSMLRYTYTAYVVIPLFIFPVI